MFTNEKAKVISIHNSLQIWYEGETDASKLKLDVNVWRLKRTFRRKIYLDFGVKVLEPEAVNRIFMYLPFDIMKENIKDLGEKLTDQFLLNGIFNENYVVNSKAKNIYVNEENNNSVIFSIYQLDNNLDIRVERRYSGTIVSFDVKDIKYPMYYRFRIETNNYGTLFEKYKPRNSFFDSAFVETEIIDFRINEKRNQDRGLVELIEDNKKFTIKSINFFVMTPIQDEINSDGINLVYKRQIEMGNFWKSYLGCEYKRMSVYKCKTTSDIKVIEDFNCFCKINYRKSNFGTILIYLLVLCLLAVLFNTLSNQIWMIIQSKLTGGM